MYQKKYYYRKNTTKTTNIQDDKSENNMTNNIENKKMINKKINIKDIKDVDKTENKIIRIWDKDELLMCSKLMEEGKTNEEISEMLKDKNRSPLSIKFKRMEYIEYLILKGNNDEEIKKKINMSDIDYENNKNEWLQSIYKKGNILKKNTYVENDIDNIKLSELRELKYKGKYNYDINVNEEINKINKKEKKKENKKMTMSEKIDELYSEKLKQENAINILNNEIIILKKMLLNLLGDKAEDIYTKIMKENSVITQ